MQHIMTDVDEVLVTGIATLIQQCQPVVTCKPLVNQNLQHKMLYLCVCLFMYHKMLYWCVYVSQNALFVFVYVSQNALFVCVFVYVSKTVSYTHLTLPTKVNV